MSSKETHPADLLHPRLLGPVIGRPLLDLEVDVLEAGLAQEGWELVGLQHGLAYPPEGLLELGPPLDAGHAGLDGVVVAEGAALELDEFVVAAGLEGAEGTLEEEQLVGDRAEEEALVDHVEAVVAESPWSVSAVWRRIAVVHARDGRLGSDWKWEACHS